jgi:hypothetical protein
MAEEETKKVETETPSETTPPPPAEPEPEPEPVAEAPKDVAEEKTVIPPSVAEEKVEESEAVAVIESNMFLSFLFPLSTIDFIFSGIW